MQNIAKNSIVMIGEGDIIDAHIKNKHYFLSKCDPCIGAFKIIKEHDKASNEYIPMTLKDFKNLKFYLDSSEINFFTYEDLKEIDHNNKNKASKKAKYHIIQEIKKYEKEIKKQINPIHQDLMDRINSFSR